jgi:hypothetical protein
MLWLYAAGLSTLSSRSSVPEEAAGASDQDGHPSAQRGCARSTTRASTISTIVGVRIVDPFQRVF